MPVRTACTYDCPDACGLLVDITEQGLRLAGDPEHPITRGFLCHRIRGHAARLRDPERLSSPLLRVDGTLRPVSWDQALDRAARELGEAMSGWGPASVVHLDSGGSLGIRKQLIGHFFHSLGPVTTVAGGVCGEAGEAAQALDFGHAASHDYSDLAHSEAVVLWGKDPVATGPHLVPFVRAARQRGAPVVLIEVRPTESEKLADRVVRVAPSGDGWLALAVLRTLHRAGGLHAPSWDRIDNPGAFLSALEDASIDDGQLQALAGVSARDVAHLAALYGARRPVATWVGWGLTRRVSGGVNLRWIDALGLLTGQVGVAGGGVNFTSIRRRGLDLSALAPASGRTVAAATLGQDLAALADPPARFVYLSRINPAATYPDAAAVDRALRGPAFTVVADAFLTDSARAADLVLPVCLMLEQNDVVGSYQHHHLARVRRVCDPPAGARDDTWILAQLARRLGLPEDPLLTDPDSALAHLTRTWQRGEPDVPGRWRNPTQAPVPFEGRFPTPSGRATLVTERPRGVPEREGYDLVLISPPSRRWQTSQQPVRDQRGLAECAVHPQTASARGLGDGDQAVLVSPVGELRVRLRADAAMTPGTCVVHRAGALHLGRAVNALVEARQTDLGGGAAFHDQRVQLRAT